jgi:hypothetical protein
MGRRTIIGIAVVVLLSFVTVAFYAAGPLDSQALPIRRRLSEHDDQLGRPARARTDAHVHALKDDSICDQIYGQCLKGCNVLPEDKGREQCKSVCRSARDACRKIHPPTP